MTTAIIPKNIDFRTWASQIRIDLPNVTMPLPPAVEHWRKWASQVVNSNQLKNVPLPTKTGYPKDEDWKKWGVYFINSMYT